MIKPSLLFLLLLASCTLIAFHANAGESKKLDTIIKAHVNAMGGWKNWSQIESLRLNGKIERDGQIVDLCVIKKRPNKIRATLTIPITGSNEGTLQIIKAHDGKNGWSATRSAGDAPLNKQKLTDHEAQELLMDASVLPKLMQLWYIGTPMRILQSHTLSNEAFTIIEASPIKSDATYTFVLDANNTVTSYTYTTHDHHTTHIRLSRYQHIDGLYLPMQMEIDSKQTGISIMTTETVARGVGIYEDYFTREDKPNNHITTNDVNLTHVTIK